MSHVTPNSAQSNFYQNRYFELIASGICDFNAATLTAENYLDGKPARRGKHKITQTERDLAFWTADFLEEIPTDLWATDVLTLALARYLDQEKVSNSGLLTRIATTEPSTVCKAMRYARMAFRPKQTRITELRQIGHECPEIKEQCLILDIFSEAFDVRQADLEKWQNALLELSPFELLIYASLYAFEHLVPVTFDIETWQLTKMKDTEVIWDAINDLIAWKLKTSPASKLKLTEKQIGLSVAGHLSPFLFRTPSGKPPRYDLLSAFEHLLAAQKEMNEFISRSVDAHSYDDSVRFVRQGASLIIEETDATARRKWLRDGEKLSRLHEYWLYRALHDFASSGMAAQQIGRPENHEANQLCFIRAIRTQLQLDEVYGIDDGVMLESGERVPIFQALLSLELTSAFFQQDFLLRYLELLRDSGNWNIALGKLALEGLIEGMQNRLPLTWSEREQKVRAIVGWTVCENAPNGSLPMAASVLDFWTNDWIRLASRLSDDSSGPVPEVLERPFLKLGQYFVQLPWITGLQNNSTAAINNLRRIGARRAEAKAETSRIEDRLGSLFETRGFKVLNNWHPDRNAYPEAGEIDLICARDGFVLVIEVKSSFIRRSQREAWLHGKTALRKAGQQLRRKVAALINMLKSESDLRETLGTRTSCEIYGLIADTSIEHDHERFEGYLKVSVEELIIALRDDRELLTDPAGVLRGPLENNLSISQPEDRNEWSLYPDGFSAPRLLAVLENELVWQGMIIG
jgi:Holliday junction resolvase-like predicted endonuclease